jgi:S-DNA-T family DNA segregation ATPase FtsK/SpoIIIE
MDRRYEVLHDAAVRNIKEYNRKNVTMPYIVIVIDELADLILTASDEDADMETMLIRLAQKARAIGIHLILATQRPTVNVVTGLIKANFPARIAFSVTSQIDSRVILDASGAETLLGKGDMLFSSESSVWRVQGAYVTDEELQRLVEYWVGTGYGKGNSQSLIT